MRYTRRVESKQNKRARDKAYRVANKARLSVGAKAYREANPEKARAGVRAWRKANPEKARAGEKAYRKANPEKLRARAKVYRACKAKSSYHGLTRVEVLARLVAQGGVCSICKATEPGGKGWPGDHNHDTGRFRAVLCSNCNLAIGLFKDSPERCRAAAAYLDRHNALDALI